MRIEQERREARGREASEREERIREERGKSSDPYGDGAELAQPANGDEQAHSSLTDMIEENREELSFAIVWVRDAELRCRERREESRSEERQSEERRSEERRSEERRSEERRH